MAEQKSYTLSRLLCWLGIIPALLAAAIFIPAVISDIVTKNYSTNDTNVSQADSVSVLSSNEKPTSLGILIGLGICAGFMPLILAFVLGLRLRRIGRLEKDQAETEVNDRILELAAKRNRRLTVIETSTSLDMALPEAQSRLESLVRLGVARLEVSESGVLVYFFDRIISDEEKNRSEAV